MVQIMAIAAGGAVGAVLRYWISSGVYQLLGRGFPWGTLVVNLLGSLAMGFLFAQLMERSTLGPEWRAAILVGLLGSFTTFSTFSIETLSLIEQTDYFKAALNILISVSACIAAAGVGVILGRIS